jgi:hypothetical protein
METKLNSSGSEGISMECLNPVQPSDCFVHGWVGLDRGCREIEELLVRERLDAIAGFPPSDAGVNQGCDADRS